MILDSTHKPWLYATAAGVGAISAVYAALLWLSIGRQTGGTAFGLASGVVGTAIIVFECLLGLRKKYPTLRVGRTYHWLKAHVWLGVAAFIVILLHSGFSMGGPVTTVLMILFGLITLSGIVGLALQQVLPRVMMTELQEEVIFEQMGVAISNLQASADEIVKKLGGVPLENNGIAILNELYTVQIRPFLFSGKRHELFGNDQKSRLLFDHLRRMFPPASHEQLGQLEKLVMRRRQLALQNNLHYALYGWLLVHVPLCAGLLVLIVVHAFMALRLT